MITPFHSSRYSYAAVSMAALLLFVAGCLGPRRAPPPPLEGEVPVEPGPPVAATGTAVSVVWEVSPAQNPLVLVETLAARPQMRLTVQLPARYFGDEEDAVKAKPLFADMVARGQVELLTDLPTRPVLALLFDSDLARSSGTLASLPPRFHWPEDVVGQAALAKSGFRRQWRVAATGLSVPWGAVAGPELEALGKAGFQWLYLGDAAAAGLYDAGRPVAVVAAAFPRKKVPAVSIKPWLAQALSQGPAFFQITGADELVSLAAAAAPLGVRWVPAGELVKEIPSDDLKPVPPSDFSRWIGDPEENRAWQLLGIARQALEDFKNSGRADVRTLDLATREIYNAEGGYVFASLGRDGSASQAAEVKRGFLASLEQVFRFLGAPAPAALRRGFAGGGAESSDTTEEPFFTRQGSALRWRDDARDDRGPGDFFYPTGAGFPIGAWDLTFFSVESKSADVVFRWGMTALANPGAAPYGFSLPLLDTYIDINRLPGAGSDIPLPGRAGLVEPSNAWEYALSVDGWGARLYQPWPGGAPRRVAVLPVRVVAPSTLEVSVPRKYLRGEPSGWGYAVAVMGRDPASTGGAEPSPMKVAQQPAADRFGGAMPGRSPPPYIDLLSEGSIQNEVLGSYKQGRDVSLPFNRIDE